MRNPSRFQLMWINHAENPRHKVSPALLCLGHHMEDPEGKKCGGRLAGGEADTRKGSGPGPERAGLALFLTQISRKEKNFTMRFYCLSLTTILASLLVTFKLITCP